MSQGGSGVLAEGQGGDGGTDQAGSRGPGVLAGSRGRAGIKGRAGRARHWAGAGRIELTASGCAAASSVISQS